MFCKLPDALSRFDLAPRHADGDFDIRRGAAFELCAHGIYEVPEFGRLVRSEPAVLIRFSHRPFHRWVLKHRLRVLLRFGQCDDEHVFFLIDLHSACFHGTGQRDDLGKVCLMGGRDCPLVPFHNFFGFRLDP